VRPAKADEGLTAAGHAETARAPAVVLLDARSFSLEEVTVVRKAAAYPALVATCVFATAPFAAARAAAMPTLRGTVGPGYTISLSQNGKRVTHLRAGTYRFDVADRAAIHSFVLEQRKGGTVSKELTSVPFTGTKTVAVVLTPGTWEFYCRPHESTMHGDFTVG
jgi:plastocyanin